MQLTLRRAACWALGIMALVVALPQASQGEDIPGIPDTDSFGRGWQAAPQSGFSYATRAKQWVRTPDSMVVFRAAAKNLPYEGDPSHDLVYVRHYQVGGQAFMVSPEGAPAGYGYLAPMTVRSVGFGLMPVEATVQVSQRREDGLPVPFESWISGEDHYDKSVQPDMFFQVGSSVHVDDAVNVQILKVLVDGVDLGLTGDCRTVTPAPMTMSSPKYTIPLEGVAAEDVSAAQDDWYRHADPDSFFQPERGGTLNGTITIPAFTGCTTASGDDLSALMTLSVSGPDNPVAARVGWRCLYREGATSYPLPAGKNTPQLAEPITTDFTGGNGAGEGKCRYGTKKFEYPERPAD